MPILTALFVGLGSIGTRHLNNLHTLCRQRGLTLQADALRSNLSRPLRPGVAEQLRAQFTDLGDAAALPLLSALWVSGRLERSDIAVSPHFHT